MVIAVYPSDLDRADGRIFSPTKSGSESLPPTPAFPVSPQTPYGKKEANLAVTVPAFLQGGDWSSSRSAFFSSDNVPTLLSVQPA